MREVLSRKRKLQKLLKGELSEAGWFFNNFFEVGFGVDLEPQEHQFASK